MKYLRIILLVLALAATVAGCRNLGVFLHRVDPLEKVDVIFALGGSRLERVVEAGDLYLEGWSPLILLAEPMVDPGERALAARGITVSSEAAFQREVLVKMGVPREAVLVVDENQASTASESHMMRRMTEANRWKRLMVVTSRLHTRRAGLAMRRQMAPIGVTVLMRAPRTERGDLDHYWRNRNDLRFAVWEAQKLAVYWIGLAD